MPPLKGDSLVPPVTGSRLRAIESRWIRVSTPPDVIAELESLAVWLDSYHDFVAEIIRANGTEP